MRGREVCCRTCADRSAHNKGAVAVRPVASPRTFRSTDLQLALAQLTVVHVPVEHHHLKQQEGPVTQFQDHLLKWRRNCCLACYRDHSKTHRLQVAATCCEQGDVMMLWELQLWRPLCLPGS